jgi:NAD(P)-dependent dehydrogenase (short-subunit alcohol dehydrogenase family)
MLKNNFTSIDEIQFDLVVLIRRFHPMLGAESPLETKGERVDFNRLAKATHKSQDSRINTRQDGKLIGRASGSLSGEGHKINMKNQVVIITGGSQGIGFGIASCFAKRKACLVIADVDGKKAEAAAKRLKRLGAADVLPLVCDIAKRPQVEAMVAATKSHFKRIDVLVNNAGICPFIEAMEMSPEIWQRTLDVNLTGAFHCTQIVAREMIKARNGGRMIFITSLAENVTSSNQVDYGASKAGLKMAMVGFCTALGKHGITCNAIAPGMIMTPMVEGYWKQPGPAAEIKVRVPMGRIGLPVDIGHAAVFLASPEAEYISGITVRVDGGFQARCV